MAETFDLKTDEGLTAACRHVEEHTAEQHSKWTESLCELLQWVRKADAAERARLEFHQRLWEDNAVSGVGMGTVPVTSVIETQDFREWLARTSLVPLPEETAKRIASLQKLYEEIVARFKASQPRIPHLKIFRVLAAFFPDDFTTLAHRGSLERFVRRMRGTAGETPVALHAYVRHRLDEVLGDPGDSLVDRVRRMELPWYLYELTEGKTTGEEKVTKQGPVPGEETLEPLPAARRRRGLTALAGGFPAILGILEEVKDGLTREELIDYLRGVNPAVKDAWRRMIPNVLRSELGVIKSIGNQYRLTERGAAVLETSSADDLGDWLLTRVLGVDHILKAIEKGPASKAELVALLQRVNPGWTTDFTPTAMLNCLLSMKVLKKADGGRLALDAIGQDWVDRVTWRPEFLETSRDEISISGEPLPPPPELPITTCSLPDIKRVVERVIREHAFEALLVRQLHFGLWGPRRRHFAILAGISGSGKTLLAQRYAEALTTDGEGPRRVHIQDVQPGWYDPTPILGYLNPLQRDSYQRTGFLNFLIRAASDTSRPYVVILDEMNLSHPEHYFAPLLSAMESGNNIRLHAEGTEFDGVPESIPYPQNLAIIGTVNMDETTHGLSDKVLDRAFTLEFWDIHLDAYPRWKKTGLSADREAQVRKCLEQLMSSLKPPRLHFGWRTVDDVIDFLARAIEQDDDVDFDAMLDAVVYAKILPKLRGEDSQRLRDALRSTCAVFDEFRLASCKSRVQAMQSDLERSGSVRFWR